jgi:hypothetical protein
VQATDSLPSIATALATAISAAITAGSDIWATDFASSSATGNTVSTVLHSGVDPSTVAIVVKLEPGSMLDILINNYPEVTSSGALEVTALKTFSYAGPSGPFIVYRNQRILVTSDVAADMFAEGLVQ